MLCGGTKWGYRVGRTAAITMGIGARPSFWATVCKTVRYRTVVLSCLSVCPVCDVRVLWPNGLMDQNETRHGCRPRPWSHCARWRPSSPSPKGHSSTIFRPCLLWANGWMDQDATWYKGMPRPRQLCARWGPSSPSKKGDSPSPIFGPCLLWPNGWMDHLIQR